MRPQPQYLHNLFFAEHLVDEPVLDVEPSGEGGFGWICLVFPIPVLFFLGVMILAILNLGRGTI